MPIKIDFLANVSKFVRGTDDAERALDDVSDSLDDVAKDGDRSLDKLERSLKGVSSESKDTARDIDRDGEKAERSFRELADAAKDASKDVGRIGDDAGTSMAEAGENVSSFKEEAVQNFSEVASSFNGDVTQMADGVQGLTGGLASSLTPGIGIPVAILGAAASAFLQQWQASMENVKQVSADTFDQIASDGVGSFETMTAYNERLKNAYSEHEDEIKGISDKLGISFETVAAAWAGNADQIAIVTAAYKDWREQNAEDFNTRGGSLASSEARKLEDLMGPLNDVLDGYDKGKQKAQQYQDQVSQALLDQIAKTRDVGVEVDELGNKIVHLPDGDVFIDANTKQASLNVDKFKGDTDDKIDRLNGREVVVKARVDDSRVRNWRPPMLPSATVYVNPKYSGLNIGRFMP